MKSFPYRCPNPKCRAALAMPESLRGRSAKCGKCSQEFVVPFVAAPTLAADKRRTVPLKKTG